jgi:hypothetical protein
MNNNVLQKSVCPIYLHIIINYNHQSRYTRRRFDIKIIYGIYTIYFLDDVRTIN